MLTDNQKKLLEQQQKKIKKAIDDLSNIEIMHEKDEALMSVVVGHKMCLSFQYITNQILLS